MQGRLIEGDFIRTAADERPHLIEGLNPAPDGQRNKAMPGLAYQRQVRALSGWRGRNVQLRTISSRAHC